MKKKTAENFEFLHPPVMQKSAGVEDFHIVVLMLKSFYTHWQVVRKRLSAFCQYKLELAHTQYKVNLSTYSYTRY
jgi:hypothetical protein